MPSYSAFEQLLKSMEIKQFAYAVVGLRPSERQDVAEMMEMACINKAQLRQTKRGEHPDFWVINGDEYDALVRLKDDPAPMIAVGGDAVCLARIERPFSLLQVEEVMSKLLIELPEKTSIDITTAEAWEKSGYATNEAWGKRGGSDDSEFASEFASRVELTDSELAMTEDDPSELMKIRRAAHEERSMHTLEPTGSSELMSHEWLDVMPAQVMVIAELGVRSRTLPSGLRRMGFSVDVIENLNAAVAAMAEKEYRVIFMEQMLTTAETVLWCKRLAETRNVLGQAPQVVIVARRKSMIERWRAMRAGCAAWMLVPLERRRLLAFLLERGVDRSLPREA